MTRDGFIDWLEFTLRGRGCDVRRYAVDGGGVEDLAIDGVCIRIVRTAGAR